MKVNIMNKWVSFKGSSEVKDENNQDVLFVEGKFFSITRKKFVQDLDKNLLYVVRNKYWNLFVKKAMIYDKDGNQVAFIRRKVFSVHDKYLINCNGCQMEITGNILGFDYHIVLNGEEVGHIARNISLRDSFTLEIKDGLELPFYVALVIAIDNITDRRRDENSVSFSSND